MLHVPRNPNREAELQAAGAMLGVEVRFHHQIMTGDDYRRSHVIEVRLGKVGQRPVFWMSPGSFKDEEGFWCHVQDQIIEVSKR